jgi:hypothetical protein
MLIVRTGTSSSHVLVFLADCEYLSENSESSAINVYHEFSKAELEPLRVDKRASKDSNQYH